MACIDCEFFTTDCTMNGLVLNGVKITLVTHGTQAPLLLAL